jgi:hypothetical protein
MRLKAAQRRKAIDMKHSLQITAAMALCLAALHTPTAAPRLLNNEPWRLKEFHIAPLK